MRRCCCSFSDQMPVRTEAPISPVILEFQGITLLSAVSTLPRHASPATAGCEALATVLLQKTGGLWSRLIDFPTHLIPGVCCGRIRSIQMASIPGRNHPSLRTLVFTLRPQLSRPRRNDARARPLARSHDDLPLGSGLCSGVREKNLSSLETDQRLLPRR